MRLLAAGCLVGVPKVALRRELGAAVAGQGGTERWAVMIDTVRPLNRTGVARRIGDSEYPFSWHTGGMRGTESIA